MAFYMKQSGGHPDRRESIEAFPSDLRIRQFPDQVVNAAAS